MTHSTAELAQETDAKNAQSNPVQRHSREDTAQNAPLDRRYHKIGISAVAAAARYQGIAKNPAYAPAETDWRLAQDAAA